MKNSHYVLETLGRGHNPVEETDGEDDIGYPTLMSWVEDHILFRR